MAHSFLINNLKGSQFYFILLLLFFFFFFQIKKLEAGSRKLLFINIDILEVNETAYNVYY